MANIVIVDTSILLNILNVPLKSDQRPEVAERLRNYIRKGDQLFLPIATVLETGNHIAQNGDGNQKRQCALRFVEMVRTGGDGFHSLGFGAPSRYRNACLMVGRLS